MQLQHSSDLIYNSFTLDEIKTLCARLDIDYEELPGKTRTAKARDLTEFLSRRGRLLELFILLNRERPHLDLSPCFHELIAEQFSTAEAMANLFAALGLTVRNFQEPEKHAWGSPAWGSDKARKLHTHCYQQGQWAQLQQTIAVQRPALLLETLQLLFPGPVQAASTPPANNTLTTNTAADRSLPAPDAPFQEALLRGQLVLFIGADFPQAVTGLPSRADLAQALAQRHGLPAGLTLAQVAQRVSRAGNRYEFTSFLRDALSRAGQAPTPFHQRLANLIQTHNLKTIITAAHDDLLEQALRQAGVPFHTVINNSDARFIQPDRLNLIKLYGAVDRPDSLIVTEQDHTQLLRDQNRDEVLSEVRRALAQNSVYFLGYNLADPSFTFIYDQIAENRFARTAYALWPGLDKVEVQMWRDRGLMILADDPLNMVSGAAVPARPSLPIDPITPAPTEAPRKGSGQADAAPIEWIGQGRRWAVLVGVNQYDDWQNYGNLEVCVKDVEAIQQALIAGGYEPERIRLLTDDSAEKPSRVNILTTLRAVANATEPEDSLLFYYSGHGDIDGNASYLIAKEGHAVALEDTAVSLTRIKEIMMEASARAKAVILDACHSGAKVGKGARPMSAEFIRRVFTEAEGMVILASCQQGEKSYEWRAKERSVFTHYLLEAMSGTADYAQKGFVSFNDAGAHVVNYVKLWASQQKVSQTPTMESKISGDIILAYYNQNEQTQEGAT
jgi:hypothetical protein